ncbi:hypothetical protein [Pleomorphomonas sp. PLEO]|uniref:hypothetical protein n=1 Tax=Pleomorphomonas sp. PLEO TaxID=3239306 RepID=UPI00351EC6A2
MQSRVVASQHTSIGTPTKKKGGKPPVASARRRKGSGHQDVRSIVIAGFVALVLASIVAAIWFNVKPFPAASSESVPRPPPSVADLEAKKTHSYWKVGNSTYRHYITDTGTGEIVDAGTVTVKEMLEQGIEVPGYSLPNKAGGASSNTDELAIRFQAIQDHLK